MMAKDFKDGSVDHSDGSALLLGHVICSLLLGFNFSGETVKLAARSHHNNSV